MDIQQLCDLICTPARRKALERLVRSTRQHEVSLDGLAGSALAVLCTALPRLAHPYLLIASDADDAGYLYNDLVQLTDEQQVLIFPS